MTARRAIVLLVQAVVYVFVFAVAAHAQSSGDEPPLDERLRGFLLRLPDQPKDLVPPTEAERSQEEVRRAQERARRSPRGAQPSRSGPGYIGPLSTETSTGRMGASGWTSPALTPPGSGGTLEEKAGQFGFGYSVEWGVPRRPEAP